ncbi:MAG TPA: hypothetical protein VHX20_09925 [Terracidiphilus sp.]|jgi:hypothetical protein|nr:hypothetical protein [Terracidiphilus sp.]
MATTPLIPGTPLTTTVPTLTADLSAAKLVAGAILHFSLVVQDDLGNSSQPALLDVTVQALPVASLGGTATVVSLANPTLSLIGKDSTPSGNLKEFTWELVSVTEPVPVPVPEPEPVNPNS